MRGTTSTTIATLAVAAALAAGCGGEEKKDEQPASTAAAPIRPAGKPTAIDRQIVRLVQKTGGRLHLDAIQLFGDRVLLDDKAALGKVAATRVKIAAQLEREATNAKAKLESLDDKASVASHVGMAGENAFDELASCGRRATAFFRKAAAENAGSPSAPAAACKSARLAYGQATTVADALREPASTRSRSRRAPR